MDLTDILTLTLTFVFINGQTLPETLAPYHSACYGTHISFRPSCTSPGTVIAVKDVYVGAKLNATECPQQVQEIDNGTHVTYKDQTTSQEVDVSKCCMYDATDCTFEYDDTNSEVLPDTYKYHRLCMGLNECSQAAQVIWYDTSGRCDSSLYPPRTNYMYMEYYCIDDTRTSDMCASVNETVTGMPFYLQSPGYPNTISSAHASCNCSVQSSVCGDTINIYTVHVMMTSESGACKQRLYIQDMDNSATSIEWNCDSQTNFNITTVTSNIQARYLQVNFENTLSSDGGYAWVGFKANSDSASLMVNCPPKPIASCTTTTTPSVSADPATGSESRDDGLMLIIGAVVGGLLAILITLAVIIYCCCCKKNKVQPEETEKGDQEDNKREEIDYERSGLDLLTSPIMAMRASVAPANTRFQSPLPVPVPFHETRYIMEHSGINQDTSGETGKKPRRLAPLVHSAMPLPVANGGLGKASGGLRDSRMSAHAVKPTNAEGHEKKKKKKKKKHKQNSNHEDKNTLKENEEIEYDQEESNTNNGEMKTKGESNV